MCSLDKLAKESRQTVDLSCRTAGGEEYDMTKTRFIEKGGRCIAKCPDGMIPSSPDIDSRVGVPQGGTECLFGGSWSNRVNCYKPCPDIDLGRGVLTVEGRTTTRQLEDTGYECSSEPYVNGKQS